MQRVAAEQAQYAEAALMTRSDVAFLVLEPAHFGKLAQ